MTAIPFEEVRAEAEDTANVRKTLGAVIFIADEDAPAIEPGTLTDATGNLIRPTGYEYLGMVTEDGITFENSVETEEVRALGHLHAVRRDISSVEHTISFTAMEWDKRIVRELADSVDLSSTALDENGELSYDVPSVPSIRYYRLFLVGKDGSLNSEVLRANFYPRVSVTSTPSETWNSTDPLQGEFTFTAYVDEETGTAVRKFLRDPRAAELGYGA